MGWAPEGARPVSVFGGAVHPVDGRGGDRGFLRPEFVPLASAGCGAIDPSRLAVMVCGSRSGQRVGTGVSPR